MIDFSIIFPSRQRTQKLGNLLSSISRTTSDISRVEVLVAVDFDDVETITFVHDHQVNSKVWPWPFVKFFVRERATNFSDQYYTWLYKQSTGRYVQALNDDTLFATKDWDSKVVAELDRCKHRDGAVYGQCEDCYGAEFCCFPILSREAVDAQGWFFHPGFTAWGADIHLWRIWEALDRVVDLRHLHRVEHLSHHCGHDVEPDEVHKRMQALSTFAHETAPMEAKRIEEVLRGRA